MALSAVRQGAIVASTVSRGIVGRLQQTVLSAPRVKRFEPQTRYVVMPPPIPSCEATFMDHRAPISLAISGFCLCLIAAHISFSFSHLSTGLTSQETGTFSQETLIPLSFKKQ
ncbi:hypothetical protein Peur_055273 [Populus x canadensis]